jgi:hypothetical protein
MRLHPIDVTARERSREPGDGSAADKAGADQQQRPAQNQVQDVGLLRAKCEAKANLAKLSSRCEINV